MEELRHPSREPSAAARGRLKVFLGYAPGVGKSFRMLDEGRRRRERGQDVVAGALQHEIPAEIQRLLKDLEVMPMIERQGVPMMDVPAILRRHPQIVLVDGLAYDHPPGSRNAHRWQDVEELLAAGVNVIGSVNLQYIDDHRERVEKITGVRVAETIPRAFLETADEIEIVDGPSEGAPVWQPALREMALVLSADVLDVGLQRYMQEQEMDPIWGPHERFLVCLTPGANADRMIANARRNADRFHCEVLAVHIRDSRRSSRRSPEDGQRLEAAFNRARAAGAQVDVLDSGDDPIETVVKYARSHGVTQIFVGHSGKHTWRSRLFGSQVSRLVRQARGMDVRVFPH